MSPSTGPPNEDTPLNEPMTAPGRESIDVVAQRLRPRLVASAQRVLRDADDAEDVVQDVMLRAANIQDSEIRSAPAWLFAVTYRVAVDRLRARQRQSKALAQATGPRVESPADAAEQREQARRIRAAVGRLSDPYKTALTLRYLEGLAFVEIAERMKTIERTARTWVGRGLTKLRAQLGGKA